MAVYEDDVTAAVLSVIFAFIMFYGAYSAATGAQAPVYRYSDEYDYAGRPVIVGRSTGQFTDAAPLCGCGMGILILVIAYLYADLLSYSIGDAAAIAIVGPSVLAGVFGILAGIIYGVQASQG